MPVNTPPTSTEISNGWSAVGALDLHEAVADAPGSNDGDTTYVACSDGTTCKLAFPAVDHPNQLDGHFIRVVSKKDVDTTQTCTLKIELYSAGILIASTQFDETDTYAGTTLTPTEAEVEAITDYGTLAVGLVDVASPLLSEHRVTSVELEIPDRILRAHVSG